MTEFKGPLVALFEEREQARKAIQELREAGFGEDRIGMLAQEARDQIADSEPGAEESKWAEGALAGGIAGAGIGGLWALGISAGVLPVVGPVIAGGLLATVLASAAGTAAVGGVVGALLGLGIPESDARYFEKEFHEGRTIVSVAANGRVSEATTILRRNGGELRNELDERMTPPPLPTDAGSRYPAPQASRNIWALLRAIKH